ncbi:phage integrase central domain-containing protein [Kitasatospora sp. NPDC001175]|uniref:phage integrase central domain-containing protein n=1 Tax=Kitasatospora sp. NPDC001175 TaxID=3157103 RepID=UPI003D00EFFA
MAHAEKVYKVRNGKKTTQYTWRARYMKPDGKLGSEPGFATKKTAEDWGNEQEALIRAGRWIDPDLPRTHFGVWAREWMAAKAPRGRTNTTRWDRLDTHILPKWKHTPLNQITWFDAENWANKVGETHDDVTATQCLTIMSQIMTGAVDAGKITVNPLFGRRRSRTAAIKAKTQAKLKAKESAPASPERVLQLARRVGPIDGMHILTTAFLGPRWGEGLALTRESRGERKEPYGNGFFTCPTLQIRQEVAEYQTRDPETGKKGPMFFDLEPVKTDGSLRDIDVPPFLDALLDEHESRVKGKYLFCTRSGTWWRNSNFGRQVMRPAADGRKALPVSKGHKAREAWEPILPNLTMDLLRHLHDTFQAQIGVKAVLAYEQAGHRMSGIKAVYQHPTPEMRKERLDGLQAIYEQAMANLGWDQIWGS